MSVLGEVSLCVSSWESGAAVVLWMHHGACLKFLHVKVSLALMENHPCWKVQVQVGSLLGESEELQNQQGILQEPGENKANSFIESMGRPLMSHPRT